MTLEGKEISETITLDKGDEDMFKTLTFISDGKLILTPDDSGAVSLLEFNVDELTRKSLVISMSGSDAKISYHFKK